MLNKRFEQLHIFLTLAALVALFMPSVLVFLFISPGCPDAIGYHCQQPYFSLNYVAQAFIRDVIDFLWFMASILVLLLPVSVPFAVVWCKENFLQIKVRQNVFKNLLKITIHAVGVIIGVGTIIAFISFQLRAQ